MGHDDFALAIYGELRQRPGNLFLSPLGIGLALGMAQEGARGETAAQMRDVLRTPPDLAEVVRRLNAAGSGEYEMAIANSLWSQEGEPLQPDFVDLIRGRYGGEIHLADFRRAARVARDTINKWVEDRTKSRIQDLIPPGGVGPDTALVLVNAVYFKGKWVLQFDRNATSIEPFHPEAGKTVKVPMMHLREIVRYMAGEGFQAVDLAYQGRDLSMLVLLPDETGGLQDLEKRLSAGMLDDCAARLAIREVKVFLPRFKITWGAVDLSEPLKALGMTLAFHPRADFSGIGGLADALFISGVFHKAFVEVNEEGTEAAAATAMAVAAGMSLRPPAIPTFRADHPFLFAIRDQSGDILFLGRVTDPTRSS